MLTERQEGLFKLLDIDPALEREIRDTHKQLVKDDLAVKDFTQYLRKWLHRRWAREQRAYTAPYLGD